MNDLEVPDTGLEGVAIPAVLSDLLVGTAIAVNSAAAALLGKAADELIGADVLSLVHPDERAAAASGIDALVSGAVDAFQVRQKRVVRADGAAVEVDISGRRLDSGSRRLALWVLAPLERGVAVGRAVGLSDTVLAVTNHDWQLEYVGTDARLLGAPREALLGAALLGLVHPSGAADFLDAVSQAVQHRITVSFPARLQAGKNEWAERDCLLVPMCEHQRPRLGIVITATTSAALAEQPADVIAVHVRHTEDDIRASEMLGTLDAIRARPGFPDLSARQVEILARVVKDEPVDAIATALYLSPSTVRNHLSALYRKFGVHSRAGLLGRLLKESSGPKT